MCAAPGPAEPDLAMNRVPPAILAAIATTALAVAAGAAEFPANALFVADGSTGLVSRLADDCSIAESFPGGGALAGAVDLAFGPNGNLFVAVADRIVELDAAGDVVHEFGADAGIAGVAAIEFGAEGHLFVACASQDRVVVFDGDGAFVRAIGDASTLSEPRGVAIGPNGNLFVASSADDVVCEFAPSGERVRAFGAGSDLDDPRRLAFGPQGRLFVASTGTGRILGFDGADLVAVIGEERTLTGPLALAFGPDSRMYVAETQSGDLYSFGADRALVGEWDSVAAEIAGLAFSPFRFSARIEGTLARIGVKPASTKEKVELSLHPGSDHLMLRFSSASPAASLAAADGGGAIVWHGFQVGEGDGSKFRSAEGVQVSTPAAARGTSSIGLRITGSVDLLGRFVAKKAVGTIHRATGAFVFSGEITTLAPLNDVP